MMDKKQERIKEDIREQFEEVEMKEDEVTEKKGYKKFKEEALKLFSGAEIAITMLFWFVATFLYFYLVSKNVVVSFGVGVLGSIFSFVVFTYQGRKLNNYQQDLNDLLKYVTNMTFFLQSGENVLYSLKSTKPTLSENIQEDVQLTIDKLENEAILDTTHFRAYEFPSLNQFHQNLAIKYEHGGNAKDLFTLIQRDMMTELKKRDELSKSRKAFALNVYMLLGMVALMPLILRFMTPELWDIFLSFKIASIVILLITVGAIALNLRFLEKHKNDISVRL